MTLTEWRSNVDLAIELKKLLDNPVMKHAMAVVDGLSMAKTLGNGAGLIQQANNAHVLFGYDSGRAAAIADLFILAEVPEEQVNIQPTYTSEF
jgi:hypothetical protein